MTSVAGSERQRSTAIGRWSSARLLGVLVLGVLVAVGLGVYGRLHDPTGRSLFTLFFTDTVSLKVWFASAVVVLACFQLLSGLRLEGRLSIPRAVPVWLGALHRVSGLLAFLCSLPVAYHCLWSLGFQSFGTRQLVHSVTGCVFYGAFTIKVTAVRARGLPRWLLATAGGTVFAAVVVLWSTSALWFFRTFGFPRF